MDRYQSAETHNHTKQVQVAQCRLKAAKERYMDNTIFIMSEVLMEKKDEVNHTDQPHTSTDDTEDNSILLNYYLTISEKFTAAVEML